MFVIEYEFDHFDLGGIYAPRSVQQLLRTSIYAKINVLECGNQKVNFGATQPDIMITENSWKKNLYALFISQFFYRAGTRSIIPFLPLFVNELGSANVESTSLWSGWIFAAPFIVSFLTTPIWGSIGDKYGRKLTALLALFGFVIAQFSMSLASSLTTLLIAASIQELLGGAYPAAVSLVAANSPKEKTTDALSYLQLANALGNISGPVMGGILADIFGFSTVFVIVAIIVAVTSLPIIFFVKEETIAKATKLYSILDNLKYFTAKKGLVGCGILLLAYTLSVTMMRPSFTLYIQDSFSGLSKPSTTAGILFSLFGSAGAASVALLPLIGKTISSKIKLTGAIIISALMFFALTWLKDIYSFALVLIILGFALGVVLPLIYSLMSDETEQNRKAGVMGIGSSFQMTGNLVGPITAGYIVTLFGLYFSFIASGIILALVILLYFFWISHD
ncbi:MAG: MFS transporter [Melioribacteraceae bacterium]